ncbi:MAG: YqgE/AlgH family protein [Planctomycetota bacterium]
MPDDSLRGRYLVAADHLRDPNFFRSVVLVVEHDEKGAMGLIINRPSQVEVRQALEGHFEVPHLTEPVFEGGPVEPAALFVLHDEVELGSPEAVVLPGLFVGNDADVFGRVIEATQKTEKPQFRVFAGCAGWGPGQLEGEIARGDWRITDAAAPSVFGDDPYEIWDRELRGAGKPHPLFPEQQGRADLN